MTVAHRLTLYQRVIHFLATGVYSGLVPPWTGTSGSVPPVLIAWLIGGDQVWLGVVTIVTIIASGIIAGEAEKFMGHDNKSIVSDEWAGYFCAVIFVPFSLTNYLIAFVLFRITDVVKLWPANVAERLPGGWGVTADDVVAGIQANLLLQAGLYLYGVLA